MDADDFDQELNHLVKATKGPPSKRARWENALEAAFQMCGGVTRLAIWADQNYAEFIHLFARQFPTAVNRQISNEPKAIQLSLPRTRLDDLPEGVERNGVTWVQ